MSNTLAILADSSFLLEIQAKRATAREKFFPKRRYV
jgi:hypothetical protein